MLGSAVLNTAIGLVLLFAVTALLCSGFTETLSNFMQLRARYLLTGLRAMLDKPEPDADENKKLSANKVAKGELHKDAKSPDKTENAVAAVATYLAAPPGQRESLPAPNLTLALFDHPAIKALQSRRVGIFKVAGKVRNPQYLSAGTFSRALIDTLFPDAVTATTAVGAGSLMTELRTRIDGLPASSLKKDLVSLVNRAGDDFSRFETSLEKWYDDQMAMISGWYKRWSRVVLGGFGLVVAIVINIDALQVAHSLYVDGPTQQAVVASADAGSLCQDQAPGSARDACTKKEIAALKADGVPIGYPSSCNPGQGDWSSCWTWSATSPFGWHDVLLKVIGWLVTAFAVSFGAPFWFEALSRLGSLRNSGTKPATTT